MAQARVQDVASIAQVRAALVVFAEEAAACLGEVDVDAQKLMLAIRSRGVPYWVTQVRKRHDAWQSAKRELARKQITYGDETPTCLEQRKIVEKAARRIEDAQERLVRVRRWASELEQLYVNYKSNVAPMSDAAGRDVPAAIVRLDRMLEALEAYRAGAALKASDDGAMGGVGGAGGGGGGGEAGVAGKDGVPA